MPFAVVRANGNVECRSYTGSQTKEAGGHDKVAGRREKQEASISPKDTIYLFRERRCQGKGRQRVCARLFRHRPQPV